MPRSFHPIGFATGIALVAACHHSPPPTNPPPQARLSHNGTTAEHSRPPHQHRFNNALHWAKRFDDPERDQWQQPDAIIDFIGLDPQTTIADLGAGTGYFTVRFARQVSKGRVFANDVEPEMVRYLNERATREDLDNITVILGQNNDPRLPEPVDIAFMCNVYHHIGDREGFFSALAQRIRPEGRVVIVDYKKNAPEQIPGPPPAMRVARNDLINQLTALGWELQRDNSSLLSYQYILEWTYPS